MRHGFIEAFISFIKGLSADTVTFTKGFVIGTLGSGFVLLNAKIGNGDLAFIIITKLCYIGATGLLTGMCVTIGKKIVNSTHNWWIKRKKKKQKSSNNFSKNGQDKNVA